MGKDVAVVVVQERPHGVELLDSKFWPDPTSIGIIFKLLSDHLANGNHPFASQLIAADIGAQTRRRIIICSHSDNGSWNHSPDAVNSFSTWRYGNHKIVIICTGLLA